MDLTGYHKLRTAVQESAHPAGEGQVWDIQARLRDGLVASGLFDQVEVGLTGDLDQMVIGLCRCAQRIQPWEAGLGVERLWAGLAAGLEWETHALGCTESMMEFEGAVTVDRSGHYVTVHLVAEPPQVTEPAEPVIEPMVEPARASGQVQGPVDLGASAAV